MAYRIGRGEQFFLTFEPYKSALLPLWRFRTVSVAEKSAADLWQRFEAFGEQGDFIGMDMARKFFQMGMTRAKRYANHAGGRKNSKASGQELPKSDNDVGKEEKEHVSQLFRKQWQRCRQHKTYMMLKGAFLAEQKAWTTS